MVGEFADNGAQLPAFQELILALAQVQGYSRATVRLLDGFQRKLTFPVRFPAHPFLGFRTRITSFERHSVRHNEGRVKADAELADELAVLRFIARQRFKETARTRPCNRADIFPDFVTVHADAIVRYRNRARFLVKIDGDFQLAVAFVQAFIAQGTEA